MDGDIPDGGRHRGTGRRSKAVGLNTVTATFNGQSTSEAQNSSLSSRVIRLSKVSVFPKQNKPSALAQNILAAGKLTDPNARSSRHNATILLLLEDWPDGFGALVRTAEMDGDDIVPLFLCDGNERFVAEDTGVSNEDMDASECFERFLDDAFTVFG